MLRQIVIVSGFLLIVATGFAQISAQIQIDRNDSAYCLGDTTFFTNASSGNYVTSHWFFGDGTDTWTKNPYHIYQSADTFTVMLVIADSAGNTDTAYKQVIVYPNVDLQLINDEDNQRLIAQVNDPENTIFKWYLDGDSLGLTSDTINYYDSGIYSITAQNQYGCFDSAWIEITVTISTTDTFEVFVYNNILTPNGDGINDRLILDLSNVSSPCQVLIYNKWGQLVYRNDNYNNTSGFEGKDNKGRPLAAGTYYYVIRCPGRKTTMGYVDLIR